MCICKDYNMKLLFSIVELKSGKVAKNLFHSVPVTVFEVPRQIKDLALVPIRATESQEWGMFSGKGMVTVNAEIECAQLVAGTPFYVKLRIENGSRKKVSDISVKLVRRVKTFQKVEGSLSVVPLSFEKVSVSKLKYPSDVFMFDGSTRREVVLDLLVPFTEATVKTQIIEISYSIQVVAKSGFRYFYFIIYILLMYKYVHVIIINDV
jgi:hypothetical protein